MNDVMTAAEGQEIKESTDAQDFVEMGSVSEETKGLPLGNWFDGGPGRFS